ncbi:hypothetical protein CHS0354_034770 [Potamilus streckersoni]|uniref:Uncharacterized protein n=1 Tax=Potamilus streckersoni TaxID=2493646 RepID=A0AAE0RSX7_9BIVA|nr:hypothetical protein CHS0354_034770 [Potamilus streckersoni]
MNRLPSLRDADPRETSVGAPSKYSKTPQAECLRRIRIKSKLSGQISNSYHSDPAHQVCLKMVEKAVIQDGTVYTLTSMWFTDPTASKMESQSTMTEEERSISRHTETHREESALSKPLSAKSTKEIESVQFSV